MMLAALPDWCVVGAAVVTYQSKRTEGEAILGPATIARITKTRVVLDDGDWFPYGLLRRNGSWSSPTELLPAGHDKIRSAQRANQRARLRYGVSSAHDDWRARPTAEATAKLAAAVAAYEAAIS
jgi:hypothetical protein